MPVSGYADAFPSHPPSIRPAMRFHTFAICVTLVIAAPKLNAQSITSIQPRSCKPGQTAKLIVHGKELNDSLKFLTSSSDIQTRIESIEATQAVIELTLAADTPLGPFGLSIAGGNGPLMQATLLADDLEVVQDNGNNHSEETAQPITLLSSVEGTCEAGKSDFYKINVSEGQRVAFEILTQPLQSAMDPVVRILAADGQTLHLDDDGPVGPDPRFSHRFATAGDYWIEVHDNRHTATGIYQLRVGDFPVVSHAYPLAIQAGQTTPIEVVGTDSEGMSPRDFSMPAEAIGHVNVNAKMKDGKSSAWVPVAVSKHPQVIEANATQPLAIPVGVSGGLTHPGEVDSYQLIGKKGELVRIQSQTRSLGCATLLKMQLFNAAGAMLAETKVTDSDEWSLDFTFPEAGDYRLDVADLLKRGGPGFGYAIEVASAGSFSVALKADVKGRQEFAIEPDHGACAIDLTIARFGYEGEIELSLAEPVEGLRILNPRIAAKVAESRVYLASDTKWTAGNLANVRLRATALGQPENYCIVDSRSLHRIKSPSILRPLSWNDGAIFLASAAKTESPFALQTAAPIQLARPLKTHTATLTLQRVNEGFKDAVVLLGNALPSGWSVAATAEKDTLTATLTDANAESSAVAELPLLVFGEFNGRGRIETYPLAVQWIDPVGVSLEFPEPLVRGGRAKVRAKIARQGKDPQPITLNFAPAVAGVTGPESIAVAADQTQVEFELAFSADVADDTRLSLTATTTFGGQNVSVSSEPTPLPIIDSPVALTVYPQQVELDGRRSQQRIAVTGLDANQSSRDWTRFARMTSADPAIAEVVAGVILPKADGKTEILVQVGSLHQRIAVVVQQMAVERPIAFETELLVALSKQGCNSGACHGSPSGKGGFRLSLRAFDQKLDELTLVREDFGRRTNSLDPQQSLLLLKPLMKVAHGGGKQLHKEDAAYQVILDWIAGGAQLDPEGTPRVVRLEVFPNQKQILRVTDGGQQLAVTAHFADGTRRDVTKLVAYETSDTNVATIDVHGFVTPHDRGEIAVLVRFLEHIETLPLMFIEPSDAFQWKSPPANNYIDELVNAKLKQLQYLPSETCSDAEFIRRTSLDVIGILPTVEQTQAFLADESADKRAKWVDALLEREEYAKFWTLKWGDLLRMTSKLVGDDGVYKYHRWVEQSLRDNMPYDEFAKQLLTGSGSTLANPPANFYRTATDMNECVETISQVFLGARLQCAKCHNHPFERWTQDNYYGLGAFFNRVQRRNTERPGEMFVYTGFEGDVIQPRTGAVMAPWLPQVGSIEANNDEDRRIAFAQWLTEPSNPYFARIEANRIWSQLFARGIVDPIDDFRDSNPPTNAPLLDALAKDFVESGYDRKHLLRVILGSRTYQASYLANSFNESDDQYFSHQQPRLLSAEQLLDAINQTLGLSQTFGSLPAGTLATQLPAPDVVKVDFLKTFGQPERSTVCACERSDDSNLGMAIELFNGPMMHGKLRDEANRFRTLIADGKSVKETIATLYLAAVCRPPSELELKVALEHCAKNEDPAAGIEDVCWALFNTDEFLFQH